MSRTRFGKISLWLLSMAALATLGATVVPRAWAYIEATYTGRIASPANRGCIYLQSFTTHTDTSITLRAVATTHGFTGTFNSSFPNGIACIAAPYHAKAIKGQLQISLLKLIRTGTTRDQYTFCRIHAAYTTSFVNGNNITFEYTYPTAPCGPGSYAHVACLIDAKTRLGDELGYYPTGTFTTTDVKRDCNISPNWHNLNHDHLTPGPVVKY